MGNGFASYMNSKEPERVYWLGKGTGSLDAIEDTEKKDEWNQLLLDNRKYMTIENELHVKGADARCEARISNASESGLSCTVTIIRDSTSEILYQSKLLDPGYYIEEIQMESKLREGWYSCTIVWSFYEPDGYEIIGEFAEKAVVIVDDQKN